MKTTRTLLLWIVFWGALLGITAGAEVDDAFSEVEDANRLLESEIEQLRLRISSLESGVSERTDELKRKDQIIQNLEMIVEENSATIDSLQSEMEALQKRGAIDAQRMLGKADARARELENQIYGLTNKVRAQFKNKEDVEARAAIAEKEIRELSHKLKSLETRNNKQKYRVQETQHALEVAKEELARTQLEAKLASSRLIEIHQAWLPVWLANHISHIQHVATVHWNKYGKPAFDLILQKASKTLIHVQQQMEPYFRTAQKKWLPVVKDQLKMIASHIRLHMQSLTDKVHEAYTRCQTTIIPHFLTVQMLLDPYFQNLINKILCQRAKKHWDVNINWIASITKPHVKEFLIFFGPCKKLLVRAYQKLFDSAVAYHHQVQAIILKTLERHERSKPLATKDFVWLMATASLAFPIYLVYWLIIVFFSKHWRVKRRTRTSQAARRQKSQRVVKESRAS